MTNNGVNLKSKQSTTQSDISSIIQQRVGIIEQKFLKMWQQAHGTSQGTVTAMVGQSGLMLLLEQAFCQAELALAQQTKDSLLQQYIDNLIDQILPLLTDYVEAETCQPVQATSITSNISQDWIMVFLKFDPRDL